jgi:hypothetical protein
MSPIDISEEDLDAGPATPVVYGPVGGTTHPNVYGPVAATTPPGLAHGELAVATWVLVTAAVVLCVTFGVGGFFAGRAGQVSESDRRAERQADRARFDAQLASDVSRARAVVRKSEKSKANARVRNAKADAYQRGLADGREEARSEVPSISYSDSCLESVPC